MNGQDVVAVFVAVLVPLVTALAGVLSLLVQDWRLRRSRADRRRLAFEDATRQVAFTVEWWTARQLLPTTPEALQDVTAVAQGWLDEASARVSAAEVQSPPYPAAGSCCSTVSSAGPQRLSGSASSSCSVS